MSSALLRKALEFVDQEEVSRDKKNKRRRSAYRPAGQERASQFKSKNKKRVSDNKPSELITEENIKKLLALSKPVTDPALTNKIVERAVKGKPLSDFIEVKQNQEEKSILFPKESFKDFEEELFCS